MPNQPEIRQILAGSDIVGESIVWDVERNCLFWVCAVTRRRFSSGCKPHPATAPAGSNRSSHGGNEMAEAFD
jgi:hypothetical protein